MNNEPSIFKACEYYEFINLDREDITYSTRCNTFPPNIKENEEKIKKIFGVILALIAINPKWSIRLLSKALGIKQTAIHYFFTINKETLMRKDNRKNFHGKNKNMEIKKDGHTLLVEDFYKDLSISDQIISSVSRSSDDIDTEDELDDDIGIKVEKFYKNLSIQEALITSPIEEADAQTQLSSSSDDIDTEDELLGDDYPWLPRNPDDNSFRFSSTLSEPTDNNYYLPEIQKIPLDNVSYNDINYYRIDGPDNTVDPQSLTQIHLEFFPPATSFPDDPQSQPLKSSFKKSR